MTEFPSRRSLLRSGGKLAASFCEANGIPTPEIVLWDRSKWRFKVCAYYDTGKIHVCVDECAEIGTAGRAWSYPGYAVDRTPYGVVAHEIGHHVDVLRAPAGTVPSRYWSRYSSDVRREAAEDALTTYCENDAEWFAEHFRLFVSNPDLLRVLRPATHSILIRDGLVPVFADTWEERLARAPERIRSAAASRVSKDTRSRRGTVQGSLFG